MYRFKVNRKIVIELDEEAAYALMALMQNPLTHTADPPDESPATVEVRREIFNGIKKALEE